VGLIRLQVRAEDFTVNVRAITISVELTRDVRVVEGARLEIALAVCDGVLQISITVADPET